MLKFAKPLIVLSAVLAAAVAIAQDRFDATYADMALLQRKDVQREVKLTEAKRAQLNQISQRHQADAKKYEDQLKAQGKNATNLTDAEKRQLASFYMALKADVFAQLAPAQLKRLREITFQAAGPSPMMDPVIAKRVGLSDAQLKNMRAIFKAGAEQANNLEKSTAAPILKPYEGIKPKNAADADRLRKEVGAKLQAAGNRIKPRINAIRASTRQKMLGVLTAAQRRTWDGLNGAKFNFGK